MDGFSLKTVMLDFIKSIKSLLISNFYSFTILLLYLEIDVLWSGLHS